MVLEANPKTHAVENSYKYKQLGRRWRHSKDLMKTNLKCYKVKNSVTSGSKWIAVGGGVDWGTGVNVR